MTDKEKLKNYLIAMGATLLLPQLITQIWDKRKRHKVADFIYNELANMFLKASEQYPTLDAHVKAKMTEEILREIKWEDEE